MTTTILKKVTWSWTQDKIKNYSKWVACHKTGHKSMQYNFFLLELEAYWRQQKWIRLNRNPTGEGLAYSKGNYSRLLCREDIIKLVCVCTCSDVQHFGTSRAVAQQAPCSMEFSRQEYWSGLPFPPPGDLPDPGIKPVIFASPALHADSLPLPSPEKPIKLISKSNYMEK